MSKWGTRGAYRRARNQYNASWRKARNRNADDEYDAGKAVEVLLFCFVGFIMFVSCVA